MEATDEGTGKVGANGSERGPMSVSQAQLSGQELLRLLDRHHAATERLQHSHERLQAEVARLSAELGYKNRLLARKNRLEALGQMSAGVAHEIRNPLGAIRLYAGLLARDLAKNTNEKRLVEKIIAGIAGMEAIVTDLLSFTRGFEPRHREVFVEDVVDDAVESTLAVIEERHVDVRLLYQDQGKKIEADAELLKRAFGNVIRNAAEAMNGGVLTIRTGVGTLKGNAVRTVSFRDSGAGISEEMKEHLFDPFASDKENGTGLGLAIVQGIVQAHEGKIEAWNAADGGAVFQFSLPMRRDRVGQGDAAGEVGGERGVQ